MILTARVSSPLNSDISFRPNTSIPSKTRIYFLSQPRTFPQPYTSSFDPLPPLLTLYLFSQSSSLNPVPSFLNPILPLSTPYLLSEFSTSPLNFVPPPSTPSLSCQPIQYLHSQSHTCMLRVFIVTTAWSHVYI